MNTVQVHNSGFMCFGAKSIKKVADFEGAVYLDDYAFDGDQWWSLFYTAVLRKPEHAHFWGIRRTPDMPEIFSANAGKVMIRSFTDKQPFWFPGIYMEAQKSFVYSRGVHDFYQTPFGFAIDGGPAYYRTVGAPPAGAVNAQFNPHTMEIRYEGNVVAVGEFAADDRRDLRR